MLAPIRRGWVLLVAIAFALAPVVPAAAHTDLISSNPDAGSSLDSPPDQLLMRFAEDILDGGARVVARDETGADVPLGPPQVNGAVLSASWPVSADSGRFTVAWRAVGDDGHPLEGQFAFRIRTADEPAVQPSPVAAEEVVAEEPQQGVNLLLPALLVVVVAAVGFFVWRSRAD